ncbi:MAG: hypothetical protein JSW30_04015 [Dehalococcoidia bacterium]|nr:MAG: hypothetical protein JSW30_04015 [Dehalococcoidia bacterium]
MNIISGATSVFNVIGLVTAIVADDIGKSILDSCPPEYLPSVEPLIPTILIILLLLAIIVVLFPIIGGVLALQRMKWGWALAGSIIAILGAFPLGVASTIFVAIAKDEFE